MKLDTERRGAPVRAAALPAWRDTQQCPCRLQDRAAVPPERCDKYPTHSRALCLTLRQRFSTLAPTHKASDPTHCATTTTSHCCRQHRSVLTNRQSSSTTKGLTIRGRPAADARVPRCCCCYCPTPPPARTSPIRGLAQTLHLKRGVRGRRGRLPCRPMFLQGIVSSSTQPEWLYSSGILF